MEYTFFESALGALDSLDGGQRKSKFINLAQANKADGKIPNWGPIFNEKINRNYLWAVEHIGNELKNKKNRIYRVNYNLILKRAEEVSKFRGKELDLYALDEKSPDVIKKLKFDNHKNVYDTWSDSIKIIGGKPFESIKNWRSGTGQQVLSSGGNPIGSSSNALQTRRISGDSGKYIGDSFKKDGINGNWRSCGGRNIRSVSGNIGRKSMGTGRCTNIASRGGGRVGGRIMSGVGSGRGINKELKNVGNSKRLGRDGISGGRGTNKIKGSRG
jgi:hypothetical protein